MAYNAAEKSRRYRQRKFARLAALPPVPCSCGCGQPIPPINKNGKGARYAHGHNPTPPPPRHYAGSDAQRKAHDALRRPGSEWMTKGYVRTTMDPGDVALHPTATRHGGSDSDSWSMPRSHLVWNEHHPSDPVVPGEHIHHRNHVRDDDWIGNLEKLDGKVHLSRHNIKRQQNRSAATGRFVANHRSGEVTTTHGLYYP